MLAAAEAHPRRLIPFVTLDLTAFDLVELEQWLERGACGVKLYEGMQAMRRHPLDDPLYAPAFAELAARGLPVLLHVNTARYGDELVALVGAHPELSLVCPHLCSSRTNLDNLEQLMRELPSLLIDTSHGGGRPGIEGFAHIEAERERLRRLISAEPERFLFGSDLVASARPHARDQLERQLAANLGLLESEQFDYWRMSEGGSRFLASYRGLDLPDEVLERVLGGNARRWLGRCLDQD